MKRTLAAITAAVAAAITFTVPAHAAAPPDELFSSAQTAFAVPMSQPASTRVEPTRVLEGELRGTHGTTSSWHALDAATTRLLATKHVDSSSEALSLHLAGAQAWDIDQDTRLLRIPVEAGQGVLVESSVNVFFDSAGIVIGKVEFSFISVSADSGQVRTWLDGRLLVDQVVSASDTPESIAPAYKKGDWWGNFLLCMNTAGVAGWLVTAISIACGAICVVTAGAGCLVCLAAAAGTAGGTVGACIEIANRVS